MTDDEKIVKAIGLCRKTDCRGCPFLMEDCGIRGKDKTVVPVKLLTAVVRLLERYKPIKVSLEGSGCDWLYVCNECRTVVSRGDNFCKECGRRLDWER